MNCLLIGGAQSVGKSEAIYRVANILIAKGFVVVAGSIPSVFTDFKVVLEGFDKSKNTIRIIINSATDTEIIINYFKDFYDANGKYDILISSIRDNDFWPRNEFYTIMNLKTLASLILEIPLAKITRRSSNFHTAISWYNLQTDMLVNHILSQNPYNI